MTLQATPSIAALEPIIRKLEYRQRLDLRDREAILALPHRMQALERHDYIVQQGDRSGYSCVLLSGFALRSKVVAKGNRQIVGVHMKGEIVGLQNSLLGVADHSVQMLTAGKIAIIAKQEINGIVADRPAVARAMWLDTLVDSSILEEWITNVGRRNARARLAHLLCEFALRLKLAGLGEQTNYELPMTQEQLGDATGLTAVHINRTIKSLEADELIRRTRARSIIIGDWRKLAQVGDFDSTYLHLREGDIDRL